MGKNKEPAKVGVYEDQQSLADLLDRQLRRSGHMILGIVNNMDDVESRTRRMAEHGMGFAVVDANLTAGESDGTEGLMIVEGIKAINPDIVTIGFSVNTKIKGADFNIDKGSKGSFHRVAQLISEQHSWRR
jgi:hypothetical protein